MHGFDSQRKCNEFLIADKASNERSLSEDCNKRSEICFTRLD